MFALGLVKLLVVGVVLGVLWYGYRWFSGMVGRRPGRDKSSDALEMKECPTCGIYRPVQGAFACDLEDCPYK